MDELLCRKEVVRSQGKVKLMMERGKETAEKSRAVVWSETRFMTHIGDSASSKMDVVTQQRGQKPPFRKEGESSQEFGV